MYSLSLTSAGGCLKRLVLRSRACVLTLCVCVCVVPGTEPDLIGSLKPSFIKWNLEGFRTGKYSFPSSVQGFCQSLDEQVSISPPSFVYGVCQVGKSSPWFERIPKRYRLRTGPSTSCVLFSLSDSCFSSRQLEVLLLIFIARADNYIGVQVKDGSKACRVRLLTWFSTCLSDLSVITPRILSACVWHAVENRCVVFSSWARGVAQLQPQGLSMLHCKVCILRLVMKDTVWRMKVQRQGSLHWNSLASGSPDELRKHHHILITPKGYQTRSASLGCSKITDHFCRWFAKNWSNASEKVAN